MVKVQVVTCDRCGKTIWREGDDPLVFPVAEVSIKIRDRRVTRELCAVCDDQLERFLMNWVVVPTQAPPKKGEKITMMPLDKARKRLNGALERWAEGAGPDEMAEALRDVLTNSRR